MKKFGADQDLSQFGNKVFILGFFAFCFFTLVFFRLYYFQVVKGDLYLSLSENISIREEKIEARRGLILDRNNKVLADNRPYFEIVIIPQHSKDISASFDALTQLIPVNREEIQKNYDKAKGTPPFMPITLIEDAPYDWVAKIRELELPDESFADALYGIEVRTVPLRVYLYPGLFSHALGYLKEVDNDNLRWWLLLMKPGRYSLGDLLGASGVEFSYDIDLRGFNGIKARVVDAKGREIKGDAELEGLVERGTENPRDGDHLVTTLDFDAQVAAAHAMEGKKGSVVALDPNTGEVLVMYSTPGYDANRITKTIDKAYWQKINLDPEKYLLNRAIQGTYPPGSTYKVVTGLAGLEEGVINDATSFSCGGGMRFGNRFFQCWNSGGHGSLALVRGFAQSCDVYFYSVGLKVGVDKLHYYANLLGLGKKTGIDIPYEQAGLIPSSEWKMKRFKQPWIESETLSISIGQGYNTVTPLQNAHMIAMLANGGKPITPHLGKEIIDAAREPVRSISYPVGDPVFKTENIHLIQEGAINVVHGHGTAGRLKSSPYKIAGKTGTAQVVGYDSKVAKSKNTNDHAWFVAYAPYDNPKIAIAVIVENGGHGGSAAAPVAQEVIDTYLSKIMPINNDDKPAALK